MNACQRAQRAELGLRTGIELDIRTLPGRVCSNGPILRAICARIKRGSGTLDVLTHVGADVAAKLEARCAPGNVGKAIAVGIANLHIFHRRDFLGHVASVRPDNPNESRSRPKQNALPNFELAP
jgi:hypothetical protein